MKPLVETNVKTLSLAILLLRMMAGLILFVAGAGKVLGWFGGFGINTTLEMFKNGMQLSAFWTYLSCYTEFIGGLLIMIGFSTHPAAIALFAHMLVATYLAGFKNFFMGGEAYPCLLMIIFLVITLSGPMTFSIDAPLSRKQKSEKINSGFSMAL
jgi:putative oxidoreductase